MSLRQMSIAGAGATPESLLSGILVGPKQIPDGQQHFTNETGAEFHLIEFNTRRDLELGVDVPIAIIRVLDSENILDPVTGTLIPDPENAGRFLQTKKTWRVIIAGPEAFEQLKTIGKGDQVSILGVVTRDETFKSRRDMANPDVLVEEHDAELHEFTASENDLTGLLDRFEIRVSAVSRAIGKSTINAAALRALARTQAAAKTPPVGNQPPSDVATQQPATAQTEPDANTQVKGKKPSRERITI